MLPVGDTIANVRAVLQQAAARGPLLRDVVVRRTDVLPPHALIALPVQVALGGPSPALWTPIRSGASIG